MIAIALAAVMCLGLFAGCSTPDSDTGNTRTITDSLGRKVEVPEKAGSIVCVGVGALRYLIYNAPLEYADLILNGDPETYLKTVTEYKPLD